MVLVEVTHVQYQAGGDWKRGHCLYQNLERVLQLFQENEILTEQEELLAMEQFLRRQIASEKEEIERLRAEIAEIQR